MLFALRKLAQKRRERRPRRIDIVAPGLTRREQEIAIHLSEKFAMAEIGDRLFISRRTVEKYAKSIHSKLGIRGKHEVRERLLEQWRHGEANRLRLSYAARRAMPLMKPQGPKDGGARRCALPLGAERVLDAPR